MKLELLPAAKRDIAAVLSNSLERFGVTARARYERLIEQALIDLRTSATPLGSKPVEAIAGLRLNHLRKSRARVAGAAVADPRHIIAYRCIAPDTLVVLRLLHDAIDLPRRLYD